MGPENVVITVGTGNNGAGVRDAGAWCTNLIQTGYWYGVDRYQAYHVGFKLACNISMGANESFDVYIGNDPYGTSSTVAYWVCEDGRAKGYYVRSY
jgi:hypothetical protein